MCPKAEIKKVGGLISTLMKYHQDLKPPLYYYAHLATGASVDGCILSLNIKKIRSAEEVSNYILDLSKKYLLDYNSGMPPIYGYYSLSGRNDAGVLSVSRSREVNILTGQKEILIDGRLGKEKLYCSVGLPILSKGLPDVTGDEIKQIVDCCLEVVRPLKSHLIIDLYNPPQN